MSAARPLVAGRPAFLQASADDAFVQGSVITSEGTRYVPYERTYAGLPVIGGDFVIAADAGGKVMANSVAMKRPIGNLSRTPTLAQADAEKVAGKQLKILDKVESTRLVVYALGEEPRLAWESTVAGTGADGANLLTVEVDALTGAVLATQDHVSEGTGDSAFNGPNPIPLNTTRSTSAGACAPVTAPCFALQDPTITGLKCHAYNINDPINSPLIKSTVDRFGNGNSSSVETGCADAMFAAQTQDRMLRQWLGRNSFDGNGGGFRIEVGLTVPNAFHMGGRDPKVQIGRNVNGQLLTSLDIVAHEFGHGIDDKTPGGKSNNNTGSSSPTRSPPPPNSSPTSRPRSTPPTSCSARWANSTGTARTAACSTRRRWGRHQLLLRIRPQRKHRGTPCRRPGQPLVLPALPGQHRLPRPGQPDLRRQRDPQRPRHQGLHPDPLQRHADEDHRQLLPALPRVDTAGRDQPVPRQLQPVQRCA